MENQENSNPVQNENIAKFIALTKERKFQLISKIPALLAALLFILSLFLPIANIMYFHPKSVTVFNFEDYDMNNLPLLLYIAVAILCMLSPEVGVKLLEQNKTKVAIALDIACGIIATICAALVSTECDSIIAQIGEVTAIRTDKGAASVLLIIACFLGAFYALGYGICLAFIRNGKLHIKEK